MEGIESGVGFLLTWGASPEENIQRYFIERSSDGIQFNTIGFVESEIGEGAAHEYEFKDLDLGLKNVTYRLKLVSTDGTISYSSQLSLKKKFVYYYEVVHKAKLSNEVFQVSINSIIEGELKCQLATNIGDILFKESKPLTPGLNDYLFDLSSEVDGIYQVIFQLDNVFETVVLNKETKDKKQNVAKKTDNSGGG